MKVSVVICNNGLGHYKRVFSIISKIKKKIDFSIFGSVKKIKKFTKIDDSNISYYNIEADINNFKNNLISSFHSQFMNMDYCWSDNLLFPYEYNKKTIITGSFLWTNNSKYLLKDLDLKILNKKDVKLIGNRYFTSPDTRKNLRFFPVGMLDDIETNKKNHKQINSILISSGNTQNGIDFLYHQILNNKDYLENISRNCKLYIEANIYDNIKFHSKNIKKATFSRSMYEEIGSAIARPGMGTITDSWNSGIKVFPFFGENDIELIHNSKVVKKIQGDKDQSSTNLIFQIKKALKYNKSLRMKKKQMKILYSLDNKGIDDTASYLEKFFKGEIN